MHVLYMSHPECWITVIHFFCLPISLFLLLLYFYSSVVLFIPLYFHYFHVVFTTIINGK